MKCYYHNADFDGICSGAIILHKYPECEMIGVDYGDSIVFQNIDPGETIFMVDFSLSSDDMIRLRDRCAFTWIDHHKSAIDLSYAKGYNNIKGIRRNDIAAAALTWDFFYDLPVPIPVHFISEYDLWNLSQDVVYFQLFLQRMNLSVFHADWQTFFKNPDTLPNYHMLATGADIYTHMYHTVGKAIKNTAIQLPWEGMNCLCMNLYLSSSLMYDMISDGEKYDMLIAYNIQANGRYKVSLRTRQENVDVSRVAVKFGGGGHKKAAGFICNELPWKETK